MPFLFILRRAIGPAPILFAPVTSLLFFPETRQLRQLLIEAPLVVVLAI
jgi:hypothetical protein